MNHQEFARLLAQKQLPPVLLFEGPEEYLKESALQALRKAILPEGLEDLNENRMTAPETAEIIAAAETLPFMADQRLILLRDFPAIVGRGEAEEKLLEYLPHVPPTAILLFYCVQPVKQKKIKNVIAKMGGVVEFKALTDRELTGFVTNEFHALGRECDARTADFLVFTVGNDLNQLRGEIAKIAAYHPEEARINPEDVKQLATPSMESKVFDMVEAVIAGQDGKAFTILRNLLQNGEKRIMILAMLLRQFRLMQHVKIMQFEKKSNQEITAALGMSSWVAGQYMRQAGLYTGRQVKEAVNLCLETDLQIKSGLLREEGALEAVMLKLLLLRKR
ncbi:MAG: DNA polymerase III subunit delta [Clostridia bacterium]|nr:DNA polymerase III subunit delta [Clostridia bacterium]MBQ9252196.1 DNA polymerase III subunit delta [Clostridia bacterium]